MIVSYIATYLVSKGVSPFFITLNNSFHNVIFKSAIEQVLS